MPTVLFVCTGNYYRSRYAELYFNARIAPELGWRADSRGFEPSPHNPGPINADVLRRLSEHGLQAPGEQRQPRILAEADLEAAERVIALDEIEHMPYVQRLFPHWHAHFAYWRVADLHAMTVAEALGAIEELVDGVIAELEQGAQGKRKGPQ
ncbi:MAG TPA: low molecular weight phosphatase family protein [Roseiflexaceae bacterium]|nr:low molecular weight phosphatase family protein [Roseiflexaceae bacterium]